MPTEVGYLTKYDQVRGIMNDDVLELTFHTNGGPMIWNRTAHREVGEALGAVARDIEPKAVIISGAGEAFCDTLDGVSFEGTTTTPIMWDVMQRETRTMIENHLSIAVPTIGIANGPARVHAELAVLCDIVLASDDAVFQDAPHFPNGVVPGDGVHVIWPLLLGTNRGRYFLLTGQELSASEALELGVVAEVHPREDLLPRARTLAQNLLRRSPLALRYSRELLAAELRQLFARHLPVGLALEGLNSVQLAGTRLNSDAGDVS